jgi:hypothetical protein
MDKGYVKKDVVGLRDAVEVWLGFSPVFHLFFQDASVFNGVQTFSCKYFQTNNPSSVPLLGNNSIIPIFILASQCSCDQIEHFLNLSTTISIVNIDQMRILFNLLDFFHSRFSLKGLNFLL